MKKISVLKQSFVLSVALLCFTHCIQAQNIFPSTGRTGIYTTSPVTSLQVKGGARIGTAANYVNVDSATGNLTFAGTGAYQVAANKYAFQFTGNPNYGLFFNSTAIQYEFRNGSAVPVFSVNANTGNSIFNGTLKVGAYTLPATDGTNGQVLKTNGSGVLTWRTDSNNTYTAGTGISVTGTTITNTAPDKTVSVTAGTGISVTGTYPNFTITNTGSLISGWSLTGNSGTSPATNFIGTTDGQPLVFKVNNQKAGYLDYLNYNTGFGYQTLNANASGVYNTANGHQALFANIIGSENTANGFQALYSNTTGFGNTATGRGALNFDTSGTVNTANGRFALYFNSNGSANTANGNSALYSNTTGAFNTANGAQALYSNATGNFNTALGYNADVTSDGLTNAMALGYNAAVNASNKVVVGNSSVAVIGGQVGWSTFSDGRFKTNIKENVPGLAFINRLRPVTYNLELKKFDKFLGKKDSLINSRQVDYAISEKKVHTGFVAQDVEKSAQELHYDFDGVNHPLNGKDNYSLIYADFVPSLVKAVQELSDSLVQSNTSLQSQINELRTMVQALTNKNGIMSPSQNIELNSAKLDQNIPNPFSNTTTINYSLPQKYSSAKIIVMDESGNTIKIFNLSGSGKGTINFSSPIMAGASYQYSLLVDGKLIDTKQMVLAK